MTPKFEVVVGNIGTVYSGNNFMQAQSKFTAYVKQSKSGVGRASGDPVTLFHNGEIRNEYLPPVLCVNCGHSSKDHRHARITGQPWCYHKDENGKNCGCIEWDAIGETE